LRLVLVLSKAISVSCLAWPSKKRSCRDAFIGVDSTVRTRGIAEFQGQVASHEASASYVCNNPATRHRFSIQMTVMLGNPQSLQRDTQSVRICGMIKKDPSSSVFWEQLQVVRLNRLGLTTVPGMCLKTRKSVEIASDHSCSWTAHS